MVFTPLGQQYLGVPGPQLVNPAVAAAFGVIALYQWWVAGRSYAVASPEGANPVAILKV